MEALDIREMAVPLNPTSTYESHLAARNGLELDHTVQGPACEAFTIIAMMARGQGAPCQILGFLSRQQSLSPLSSALKPLKPLVSE